MNTIKLLIATLPLLVSSGMSAEDTKIPASHPEINYMGRIHWDEKGNGSFTFPGTSALFNFKGTSLKMATSPGSGKFIVEIDGKKPVPVNFSPSDSVMIIADNLADTIHNAKIVYAIEGYEFHPQFRAFYTDGEIMPKDKRPDLKIEFIGNSITCGYGVEEDDPQKGFSYDTENHTLSYAYKTAQALNADFNVVSRSGIGIYRNYGSPKEGDVKTMPLEYDYTLLYNHDYKWDFSKFIPNVVCINLGTNDTSEGNYDIDLFENNYRNFLKHLRDVYPDTKIVLLTGSMLQGEDLNKVKEVLDRLASEDSNFYRFDMSPQTGELGYGADYHPSRQQAQKMADELTAYLTYLIAQ